MTPSKREGKSVVLWLKSRKFPAPRTDNSTGFSYQDGNQKSNGFEFDLKANTNNGFSAIAGYVYNENKYIRSSSSQGMYTVGTPKNVANLWTSYRFIQSNTLKNFGIGLGGNYAANSFYDANNTITLPSYFILNSSIFYDNQIWRVGLAVNNLTNKKYWSSIATPQMLRNISLNVAFKF